MENVGACNLYIFIGLKYLFGFVLELRLRRKEVYIYVNIYIDILVNASACKHMQTHANILLLL